MASLKLADKSCDINYYDYRDTLFYRKFKYRLRLQIKYFRYALGCRSVVELENRLNRGYLGYRNSPDDIKFIKNNIHTYKGLIEFIKTIKKSPDFSIRGEGRCLSVFGNDLTVFLDLSKNLKVQYDITEAIAGQDTGIKYFFRMPKHEYRIYLKNKTVSSDFAKSLKSILDNNSKSLTASHALNKWVNITDGNRLYQQKYCRANYYIDYSDESMLSYLILVNGDMFGKKYKLEKRQDIR